MSTEDPNILVELWKANLFNRCRRAIHVVEALRQAHRERTGSDLTGPDDCTPDDMKRAIRILRANGRPEDIP